MIPCQLGFTGAGRHYTERSFAANSSVPSLCAALLSPRPPSLLALNEPETSLHPDLIEPLARLIVRASKDTQLWITTHSRALAEKVEEHSGMPRIELKLSNGETRINQ